MLDSEFGQYRPGLTVSMLVTRVGNIVENKSMEYMTAEAAHLARK